MGWRFRKSVKIGPVRVNLGKQGVSSVSIGGKRARVRVDRKGRSYGGFRAGGGLSYETRLDNRSQDSAFTSASSFNWPWAIGIGILLLVCVCPILI